MTRFSLFHDLNFPNGRIVVKPEFFGFEIASILVCKLHVSTLSPFLKPTLHLYLYVSYPPIQIHIHYTHPYSQPLPQPFYSPISPISSIVPTHIAIPTFIHTYDSWQIGSKHFLTNSSNFSCKSFETQN